METSLELSLKNKKLELFGVGEVNANPDSAIINFTIETRDKDINKALAQNKLITNNIFTSLYNIGYQESDLETINFYVQKDYDYINGKQEFRGYKVINEVKLTVKDLSLIDKTIDVITTNNGLVKSIEFTVSNEDFYYQQALSKAIDNTYEKMLTVEKTIQKNIDKTPIKIEEIMPGTIQPYAYSQEAVKFNASIQPKLVNIVAKVKAEYTY